MPSMTKLDAVNACLAAINEYRVTALDTNGTSIAAEAERYVDDSTRYLCPRLSMQHHPKQGVHAKPRHARSVSRI